MPGFWERKGRLSLPGAPPGLFVLETISWTNPTTRESMMGESENIVGKDAEEYHGLLRKLGLEGEDAGQHRNRAHRRFNFDIPETKFILGIGDEMCPLYDVSVGGLSFFSKHHHETETNLELDFDHRFHVTVIVVNSFLDKAGSMEGEAFFRHGCRFLDENDGYRCVVAVLNQYLKSLMEGA